MTQETKHSKYAEYQANYYKVNQEKIDARKRAYRQGIISDRMALIPKPCKECGCKTLPNPKGRTKVFCSNACRNKCHRRNIKELKEQNKMLREALEKLVFMHTCEQEGISSGIPTPNQWLQAVDEAQEALAQPVTDKE